MALITNLRKSDELPDILPAMAQICWEQTKAIVEELNRREHDRRQVQQDQDKLRPVPLPQHIDAGLIAIVAGIGSSVVAAHPQGMHPAVLSSLVKLLATHATGDPKIAGVFLLTVATEMMGAEKVQGEDVFKAVVDLPKAPTKH